MGINSDNLLMNFNRITNITSTQIGCTRFSYSKEDLEVRNILIDDMTSLGMKVNTDFVGNIRAKYNPDNLESKAILIGSHIDTVKCGGKYDGLTGVLSSIEVIRYIKNKLILMGKTSVV